MKCVPYLFVRQKKAEEEAQSKSPSCPSLRSKPPILWASSGVPLSAAWAHTHTHKHHFVHPGAHYQTANPKATENLQKVHVAALTALHSLIPRGRNDTWKKACFGRDIQRVQLFTVINVELLFPPPPSSLVSSHSLWWFKPTDADRHNGSGGGGGSETGLIKEKYVQEVGVKMWCCRDKGKGKSC